MTTTTSDTRINEKIVVLPEITISPSARAAAERTRDLLDDIEPRLEELLAIAMQARDARDRVLVALYPYVGASTDEVLELAGKITGWDPLAERLAVLGEMFEPNDMYAGGMPLSEIARGGEPDIQPGSYATIPGPDGVPVRVMVERRPKGADEPYVVVNATDLETRYNASHDEIQAGLEEAKIR
jgi:hypothetical protein